MIQIVRRICGNLLLDATNETDHTNEILGDLNHVVSHWIKDYDNYYKYFGTLLKCIETHSRKSLHISLFAFHDYFKQIVSLPVESEFDLSILDIHIDDEIREKYRHLVKKNFAGKSQFRVSEFEVDTEQLSDDDVKAVICYIVQRLERSAINLNWTAEYFTDLLSEMSLLRGLCKKVSRLELFYHSLNIYFDKLSLAEYPQDARNLCEEILIASFLDGLPFYGFFICFKAYSNAGNLHAALLYGIMCFVSVLSDGKILNDKFLYEIIWQTIKFFRNTHMSPFAIDIYEGIPPTIKLTAYERQSLDLSYYSVLVQTRDVDVVRGLDDYLGRHREALLAGGQKQCFPWLILLYNAKRLLPGKFEGSGLVSIESLFEMVVPAEMVAKQKAIIEGDSAVIKGHLKESLLKLLATFYMGDFVYDNEPAVKMAHRLIEDSFTKHDTEASLLAMLVLSDYSMLFLETISAKAAPFQIKKVDISTFYSHYPDPIASVDGFKLGVQQALVLLFAPEDQLFQMTYWNRGYQYKKFENWDRNAFSEWSKSIVPGIDFETSKKGRYNDTITFLYEDYIYQGEVITKQIIFPAISVEEQVSEVFIVKDMELSELPHNLLLRSDGQLIGLDCSITNILSVEWLDNKLKEETEVNSLTKSLWIPLDIADSTLNILIGKCEEMLDQYKVKVFNTAKPAAILDSTINIIASHGSENISSTHVVYPNDDHTIFDLDKIVGNGKILVMLVCFSGSAQKDFYRNQVNSLVKKYLAKGYEAVVAPFWALNIEIPPVWLPAFFDALEQSNPINEAVFKANKAVYNLYPTPSAWACMHLYGNPFFKIQQSE